MNEEHELEKLVIKNLEIIEQSRKLLYDTIDPEFKKKLKKLIVCELPQILPGFYVYHDHFKDNVLDIDKDSWKFGNSWCTWSISFDPVNWKPFSYLWLLSNIDKTNPKILFESDREFNKKFNVNFGIEVQTLYSTHKERLDTAGFQIEDNKLYVPFQLELETILADWPNLTVHSIKPWLNALESVSKVIDIFDDFVKRITGPK